MVQNLCTQFSSPILTLSSPSDPSEQTAYHSFPTPSSLAKSTVSQKLRSLGFGYRADFIQCTAELLLQEHGTDEAAMKFLSGLRAQPTDVAREALLRYKGVGRKVADCVLLMSIDKVDWIFNSYQFTNANSSLQFLPSETSSP